VLVLPEPTKICLVVPTYNERENIPPFLEAVRAVRDQKTTILFVDDSSPDGTADIIRNEAEHDPLVKLMVRKGKMGIGSAYQDGFREALGSVSPRVIVQMDADLQHPPSAIGSLVQAVEDGADAAIASRYVAGGGSSGWSRWRRMVSRVANGYARTMLGLKVKDATSGFRAYSRGATEEIINAGLPAKGFEFQVLSIRLLQRNMKMVEVPYTFSVRVAGASKLRFVDVLRFFFSVLRLSLS
jgi:dolichol-phosphate mannosyltransferase